MNTEQRILEALSRLEHEQWMEWAQEILDTEDISHERRVRWQADCVPYEQLPESRKKLDRPYARKVLDILQKELPQSDIFAE